MDVPGNYMWPTLNMVPFSKGIDNAYPSVAIQREGKTLHTAAGAVAITEACAYENCNPVVGLTGPALTARPTIGNGSGTNGKPISRSSESMLIDGTSGGILSCRDLDQCSSGVSVHPGNLGTSRRREFSPYVRRLLSCEMILGTFMSSDFLV